MKNYHGTTDTFPCGHPRTLANSRKVGVAGVRCKICRRAIDKAHREKKAKAA